ncbi:MAG: cysteine-rich KTR domain-containing protein [Defluviitaleaceae bacterium]|nr:cysteine-rich KTR domain-containing protein [Defluviitaleaceae bacterium]
MGKDGWLLCPVCDNKTKNKIREDTVLENFPLFCPKCKKETIISMRHIRRLSTERTESHSTVFSG